MDTIPVITITRILLYKFLNKSKSSRTIYTSGTFTSIVNGNLLKGFWKEITLLATGSILPFDRHVSNNFLEINYKFDTYLKKF